MPNPLHGGGTLTAGASVAAPGPSPGPGGAVSTAGSMPGTPFSPASFGEPTWPNPAGSASSTSQADGEENDSLTLNQKNMLKVRLLSCKCDNREASVEPCSLTSQVSVADSDDKTLAL